MAEIWNYLFKTAQKNEKPKTYNFDFWGFEVFKNLKLVFSKLFYSPGFWTTKKRDHLRWKLFDNAEWRINDLPGGQNNEVDDW